MDFVKDWPQYALEGEASHYLERHDVLPDISEQTRYLIFLRPARFKKIDLFLLNSNWIRLLFTRKNGDFGAISVTGRNCTAPVCRKWSATYRMGLVTHSGLVWLGRGPEPVEMEVNIQEGGLGFMEQTLSSNRSGTMCDVCEWLVPGLCRCCSHYNGYPI